MPLLNSFILSRASILLSTMLKRLLRNGVHVPQQLKSPTMMETTSVQILQRLTSRCHTAGRLSTLHYDHSYGVSPVYKQPMIVNLITNQVFSNPHLPPPSPASILLAAFFGLLGDDNDDDPTKVPPSVKRLLLKAHRYRTSGAYQRAERACHQALKILSTSKHSMSQAYIEGRAYVLDTLANIYLEQRQLDKAEASFTETMRVMLHAGMKQDSEAIIEISLKLSKIYANQKKYEAAAVGFLWCTEKAREKWQQAQSPESHALLGMCIHGLGQYYLIVGKYREAGDAFSEAVDIAREVYGQDDIQVAVILNDLGTALDGEGKYRKAEEVVRQSLATAWLNKNVTEIDEYLAIIYSNLAEIQSHQGNGRAAVETCNKAKAFAKKAGDNLLYDMIRKRCSVVDS